MSDALIRVAVLSDIHAAIPGDKGLVDSYASTAPSADSIYRDAILSLEKFIESSGVRADYLVCCGDMANKANPTAMNYIWKKYNEIAKQLGAVPVTTVGNHDIDSRYTESDFDARGVLRRLHPSYPLLDPTKTHEYWSRNFVVLNYARARFIVLNSCAYHGVNPDPKAPEYAHGRISVSTLDDLKTTINHESGHCIVNALICHHHPHKHQDVDDDDYSSMQGGEKLIDLLAESTLGTWMVIHGHRHHPRLVYAAGAGRAPIIFGAGSLSAKLNGALAARARNQFYIVEFDGSKSDSLDIAGQVRAWDYALGSGWVPAKKNSGLPSRSGFGYRLQVRPDALRVANAVRNLDGIAKWENLLHAVPELAFTLPADLQSLERELIQNHNIAMISDEFGEPIHFASRA